MTEASWGEAGSPDIDWRMSAALENVPRGESELAEVTSLEGAVRAWLALDPAHQEDAVLTPERPLLVEGCRWPRSVGTTSVRWRCGCRDQTPRAPTTIGTWTRRDEGAAHPWEAVASRMFNRL